MAAMNISPEALAVIDAIRKLPDTVENYRAVLGELSRLFDGLASDTGYSGYECVSAPIDEALGALDDCYLSEAA